jgi:hypothetical protein
MTDFTPLFTTTQDLRKSMLRNLIQRDAMSDDNYFALVRFVSMFVSSVHEALASRNATPWQHHDIEVAKLMNDALEASGLSAAYPTVMASSSDERDTNELVMRQARDYAYSVMLKLNSGLLV